MNTSTPKLTLGLTLDGSVTAGAYIAGVLDYLFEILDAWEDAKKTGSPYIPKHDICIEVITGASGGGISGAIALLSLFQKRYPGTAGKRNDDAYLKKNKLYDAWVNLTDADMINPLLEVSDITDKVVSMLNSSFIEILTKKVLTYEPDEGQAPPVYIDPQLKLVMSLSNLEGFKYSLGFEGPGATDYLMTQHRDYGFFRVGKSYDGLGWIPLSFPDNIGLVELGQCSQSTAAFPIGLAYRLFERDIKYILENPLLIDGHLQLREPNPASLPGGIYAAYFVDGGLLNNEPFDMAAKILSGDDSQESLPPEQKTSSECFDKTILMIEPFPSEDFITEEKYKKGMVSFAKQSEKKGAPKFPFSVWQVISRIYTTMRTQLRFKENEISKAIDSDDYSRFIISPRRKGKDGKEYNGSIAIACGALDGFSGFFDIEFRKHDFYLGRANCQSFIQKYFRVPENTSNPIFLAGYQNGLARQKFIFTDPADGKKYLPIIPDIKYKIDEEPGYTYPSYDIDAFDKYKEAIVKRLRLVIKASVKNKGVQFILRLVYFFVKTMLFKKIKSTIEDQFRTWGISK